MEYIYFFMQPYTFWMILLRELWKFVSPTKFSNQNDRRHHFGDAISDYLNGKFDDDRCHDNDMMMMRDDMWTFVRAELKGNSTVSNLRR